MSDPRRWRDNPAGQMPGTEILLRGARRPQPPAAHELERLGAAVDVMARAPAPAPASWLRLGVAALAAFIVVGGGTFVWALHARNEKRAADAAAEQAAREAARPRRPALALVDAKPIEAAAPAHAPPVPAARPARRHAAEPRVTPSPAPPAAPTDLLAREIPLIDAARSDLAASPARALAALETHRREFPHGQLAAEREFLAVQALLQLARPADARQRAAELANRYPSSSYAARAARLIEDVKTHGQ
jgi:hypothetical protein